MEYTVGGETRPWNDDELSTLAIAPQRLETIFLCSDNGIYRSDNDGKTWSKLSESPTAVLSIYIDPTSPPDKMVCFAATSNGVYRSSDVGKTWQHCSIGLPSQELRSFWAGTDAETKQTILYCVIPSKKVDGKFTGGVYKSTNGGNSWQSAMGDGIHTELGLHKYGESDIDQYYFISGVTNSPSKIYVTNRGTGYDPPHHYTVFRSKDAGESWADCFFNDPRFKENNTHVGWLFYDRSRGFGDYALGFSANSNDPDLAIYANYGEVFVTQDGGKAWEQRYSRRVEKGDRPGKGQAWTSIGLEDTTCWHYTVDPNDESRHFICYTDIGLARSTDSGRSWTHVDDGLPWRNTIYQIAGEDSPTPRLWAACSNQHDIPTWRYVQGPTAEGGICRSDDLGLSWKPLEGLPKAPATCVVLDSKSPRENRTLFAGIYGHGVYRTDDAGDTWTNVSNGIEPAENRQVVALHLHSDGTLFCSVAGRRAGNGVDKNTTGGVYRSRDRGQNWQRISNDDIFRPVEFCVDPSDSDIIYVAAMDGLGHRGGVYRTADGGKYWHHSVPEFDREVSDYIECYAVMIDPVTKQDLYLTTLTHGIFQSKDKGRSWRALSIEESPPFKACLRMTHDARDNSFWITTFGGGVWKGRIGRPRVAKPKTQQLN